MPRMESQLVMSSDDDATDGAAMGGVLARIDTEGNQATSEPASYEAGAQTEDPGQGSGLHADRGGHWDVAFGTPHIAGISSHLARVGNSCYGNILFTTHEWG